MSTGERQRPPTPVLIVVVLYAVVAAFFITLGIIGLILAVATDGSYVGPSLILAALAIIPGVIAQGLWRGYRGSRNFAIGTGILGLPVGLIIVLLLTAQSSREWFAPSTRVEGPADSRAAQRGRERRRRIEKS